MQKATVEKELEKAYNIFWTGVQITCATVRQQVVVPYCNEHKLNFISGMGTYGFGSNGKSIDKESLPIDVYSILELEIPNTGQTIGSYMHDYYSSVK